MAIYFEWDDKKNATNRKLHGIDFEDASFAMDDPFCITREDSVVDGEQRWKTIGVAFGITVLLIIHLQEEFAGDMFVRMISARRATATERSDYDKNDS